MSRRVARLALARANCTGEARDCRGAEVVAGARGDETEQRAAAAYRENQAMAAITARGLASGGGRNAMPENGLGRPPGRERGLFSWQGER